MGYDQRAYENHCSQQGHRITAITTNKVWDEKTKVYFEEIQTLCADCGMSLEELRGPKKQKRNRKPKVVSTAEVSA